MIVVAIGMAVLGSAVCGACWLAEKFRAPEVVRHVRAWTRAKESYKKMNTSNTMTDER